MAQIMMLFKRCQIASSSLLSSSLPSRRPPTQLLSLMSASILIAGIHTSLVHLSGLPVTAVSVSFVDRIARRVAVAVTSRNNLFALTINGGPRGPFTAVLGCSVQQNIGVDVSLELDWTSSIRE
jgi:hypothetical protein